MSSKIFIWIILVYTSVHSKIILNLYNLLFNTNIFRYIDLSNNNSVTNIYKLF